MARPFCQPLIWRPAAQNWTVVAVRRAAQAVITSVTATTIRNRARVRVIAPPPSSAVSPRTHLRGRGVENPVGLADVQKREHPGHTEFGQGEQIGDVDLTEDPGLHEVRGEADAQRD